jgi:hypothetical protein
MINFQSMSKISGNAYQNVVKLHLEDKGYYKIDNDVYIQGTGCEVDFVASNPQLGTIYVECKGGYNGENKRPGAKRTDNVKKSIANAALIKALYPDYYYVVYFSSKPKPASYSNEMLKTALQFGIVNEVVYLAYNGKEL